MRFPKPLPLPFLACTTTPLGQSKLAQIMFTFELARRLEGSAVTVNALNPGVVKTELGR